MSAPSHRPPIVSTTVTGLSTPISDLTDEKASRIVARARVLSARYVQFLVVYAIVGIMIFVSGLFFLTPSFCGFGSDLVVQVLNTTLLIPVVGLILRETYMRAWRTIAFGHAAFLGLYLVFALVHGIAFGNAAAWSDPSGYIFFLIALAEVAGVIVIDLVVALVSIPMLVSASRAYSATSESASMRQRQTEAFSVSTWWQRRYRPSTARM